MCLQYLSTEIITKIFEYCDIIELYNLQLTCKRFYVIIQKATTLGNIRPFLVTNQLGQNIKRRSLKLLTLNEKFSKLQNWENGFYKEYSLLKEKKKFMPKVVLTNTTLWISKGHEIFGHKRNAIGISLLKKDIAPVPISFESDISTFVYKNNCFVTGQQDGSIYTKKLKEEIVCIKNAHDSDIHGIDLSDSTFISGAKNGSFKIWNLETYKAHYCWKVEDRIWSVALSRGCEYIGIGTAKNNGIPLYIYDTNRCKILHELGQTLPKGMGFLQIKWETPYTLLSCGYDSNVYKWDLRCGAYVQAWRDPFASPVYCFDTDDYCTLVTGLAINGRTVLWDMRMTSYIQMYFMESCKKFSSPIYSLAFDVDHLFTATDSNLNIMHFSLKTGKAKNYNKTVLPFLV